MMPSEFLIESKFRFVLGEPPNTAGSDKIVYKVTDGRQFLAAKIYRLENTASLEPIDRSACATEELTTYQILRKTLLSPFVPHPYELIKENNEPVGLLIEWKNAKEELREIYQRKFIPGQKIDTLEHALLSLTRNEWVGPDCLDEYNICYGRTGLWFAELERKDSYPSQEAYQSYVKDRMNYLRENYTR